MDLVTEESEKCQGHLAFENFFFLFVSLTFSHTVIRHNLWGQIILVLKIDLSLYKT